MMKIWPVGVILLFTVITDWVQADWPQAVFRAAACVLCSAYIAITVRKGPPRLNWVMIPLGLFAAWGLLQLAAGTTVWRYQTWRATLQWTAYLAWFVAALQCLALRSSLRVFAWFGGLYSVYVLIQYANSSTVGDRMSGTFLNQNHYAALMELLFPIVLWRFFRDRGKSIYVLCGLLMAVSVAWGGSRTGMLLLFLELLYLGLRTSRRPLYVLSGAVAIAALAVGVMWTRFEKLSSSEPYDSRGATARASLQMIRSKPLLGYGLDTWPNVYPAFAERDTGFRLIHADDDWLEWTAEGGLPFGIFMLALAGFALRSAWKQPWCVGCLAVMLHSLVEFPLQKQALWAWLLLLLAAAQPFSALRKHAS